MFKILTEIGLVALLWLGVVLGGLAIYFFYRLIKDEFKDDLF